MELCICKPSGKVISSLEYNRLQKLVRRVVANKLLGLPIPKDPAATSEQWTRRWYQKWYLPVYQDLIAKLEVSELLLALYSGSWKADQLVGHHLYWQAKHNAATNMGSSIGARKKHMLEAEDSKDFEDECDDQRSRDVTSGKADCSAPVAKKRKKKAKGMGMSKDKGVSNIVSIHSRITDHLITF